MHSPELPWLSAGAIFPPTDRAWGPDSEAPGLLAIGGELDTGMLLQAYSNGIFPWFSDGQPILWWSPDPRMVLRPNEFRLHRSLRRVLQNFIARQNWEIRVDTGFNEVIQACSESPRNGQTGTWIVPSMVQAYAKLHQEGYAHSVETWVNNELVGGLYCVAIGNALFGESMFTRVTDASKIALAALVAIAIESGVTLIDCQQNTRHLASLGAKPMPRTQFTREIKDAQLQPGPVWKFSPLYWNHVLSA